MKLKKHKGTGKRSTSCTQKHSYGGTDQIFYENIFMKNIYHDGLFKELAVPSHFNRSHIDSIHKKENRNKHQQL